MAPVAELLSNIIQLLSQQFSLWKWGNQYVLDSEGKHHIFTAEKLQQMMFGICS